MAHHGRAVTRVLDLPAAVINVYLKVDIALWPASSPFGQLHVLGPAVGHMGVALASCRFRHRRGSRMGQHGAVGKEPGPVERHDGPAPAPAARSFPRPRFPTRGCRRRRRVRRPGRLSGRTPRAWPGTAWIGELTATGRSSSGQAGQSPALSGQTAFFRVLERILARSEGLRVAGTRSVPDRWPAGWSEAGDGAVLACIYICIGRGEGSRAIDKTHATETRGTWQKPLLVVCLRNNRVLWRPSASRRSVPLPQRTTAGTPSSAGLARNTAASPYHTTISQTDH